MPLTTPYALAQVSVNAGAPVSGGIDVPSGATLQFSGVSTVGWLQQRWELYEYPEGFATPSGWSLAADGTIFSTAVTPPLVTLPASSVLWGPWSLRLKVNEAVSNNVTTVPNLTDVGTICLMLSPKGQRMVAALEGVQFCTSTTLQKAWLRTYQRNLRILEGLIGAGGGGGGAVTVASRSTATSTSWVAGTDCLIIFTATGQIGTLPVAPSNGQRCEAKCAFASGTLTVNGGGHNIEQYPGASATTDTMSAGEMRAYTYDSASTLWMRD